MDRRRGQEIPGESQGAVKRVGEKCRGEMGRHRTVNEREGETTKKGPTSPHDTNCKGGSSSRNSRREVGLRSRLLGIMDERCAGV